MPFFIILMFLKLSRSHFEFIWIFSPRCSFADKGCGLHVSWRLLIKCQSEITAGHDLPDCDGAPVTSGNLSTYICMLRCATACPVSHYLRALLLPTSLCIWVRAAYICSLQSPKFLSMLIDQLDCDPESTAVAVQTLTGVQRGNLVSYEPCVL